jgi:hypothetical protein
MFMGSGTGVRTTCSGFSTEKALELFKDLTYTKKNRNLKKT